MFVHSSPGGKVHFSSSIFLRKLSASSETLCSLIKVGASLCRFLGANFLSASPVNPLQCDVPQASAAVI